MERIILATREECDGIILRGLQTVFRYARDDGECPFGAPGDRLWLWLIKKTGGYNAIRRDTRSRRIWNEEAYAAEHGWLRDPTGGWLIFMPDHGRRLSFEKIPRPNLAQREVLDITAISRVRYGDVTSKTRNGAPKPPPIFFPTQPEADAFKANRDSMLWRIDFVRGAFYGPVRPGWGPQRGGQVQHLC